MKITKDGKYVTRKDKYPVEILATDMANDLSILARAKTPNGWVSIACSSDGDCYFDGWDLIEAPETENKLHLTLEEFSRLCDKVKTLEVKVRQLEQRPVWSPTWSPYQYFDNKQNSQG